MRIAVVTQSPRENFTMSRCPRGMVAVPTYWHAMGHKVLLTFKEDLPSPLKMLRMIRQFAPDIVVTSWLAAPLAVAWRQMYLLRCPVVHAWDDHYAEMSLFPAWSVRPFEYFSIRYADFVTSPSRSNCQAAMRMGKPVRYVPHGADPFVMADGNEPSLRGKFIIVYSGDQSLYKRTDDLVRAVAGLPCELYLFGPINEALRAGAPENVHFMRSIPQSQLGAVYAQADLLAVTADQDSTFKVFEYLRARKPILGRTGRLATTLEHGKTAWLTNDFRAGIVYLMEHSEIMRELRNHVAAIPVYTWPQVALLYADLLADLLSKGAWAVASDDLSDRQYAGYVDRAKDLVANVDESWVDVMRVKACR